MRVSVVPPPAFARFFRQTLEVEVDPNELVESVKGKVQKLLEKFGLGGMCSKLAHQNQTMSEDQPLRVYEVEEDDVLQILAGHHGSYVPPSQAMSFLPVSTKGEKRPASFWDPDSLPVEKQRMLAAAGALGRTEVEIDGRSLGRNLKCPFTIRASVYGDKGARKMMEDEHLICPSLSLVDPELPACRDFAVFAIFDGHRGRQSASFCKAFICEHLIKYIRLFPGTGPLTSEQIKIAGNRAFRALDKALASAVPGCQDGSSCIVALIRETEVYVAYLGDSSAYLSRRLSDEDVTDLQVQGAHDKAIPQSRICAIPLSRQHKAWTQKEKERVEESQLQVPLFLGGGFIIEGRIQGVLEVGRSFGDFPMKGLGVISTPDWYMARIRASSDDAIVLGCDGFWSTLSSQDGMEQTLTQLNREEARALKEGRKMEVRRVCRDMVRYVIDEKKAQDNASMLCIQIVGR